MDSRTKKVIAIIIVITIVLSGLVLILANQKPEPIPSLAQKMIIVPDDMPGQGWYGVSYYRGPSPQYINVSSEYTTELFNNTTPLGFLLTLWVFNTSSDCHASFLRAKSIPNGPIENISLGDEAVYVLEGGYQQLIFTKATTMVWITITLDYHANETTAIGIGTLQLEKIDHYLGN